MARAATKRKSESVLPVATAKLRRTANMAKKDVSDATEAEEESSDGLFVHDHPGPVKKGNLKARQSEPVQRLRHDEYEEDLGRTETQQFLALVEFESKKKKNAAKEASEYLEHFKKGVEEEGKALQKNLQDLRNAFSKKEAVFRKAFEMTFCSATPFESGSQLIDPSEHRSFASMYRKNTKLSEDAQTLVSKFGQVTQRISELDTTGLVESGWEEEDEVTTNLIAIGKRVGIGKCQSILMASKTLPMDPEITEIAETLYQSQDDQFLGNWGKIARKQGKAAQRMVKTLAMNVS